MFVFFKADLSITVGSDFSLPLLVLFVMVESLDEPSPSEPSLLSTKSLLADEETVDEERADLLTRIDLTVFLIDVPKADCFEAGGCWCCCSI